MSKTNKILVAILAVLLLVLGVIGGVIATKSGVFSSRTLAEPFNETRYSGTVENAEGLSDEIVPVVLVIRFHDEGETGELTSPTLKRHSTLMRTEENTYREEIVHGEGESGTEWTFTPGEDESMEVSYTTPDGATASAELPKTDPADTSGEVGLNPSAPGAEPDGTEFPDHSQRTTGTLELTSDDAGDSSTDVIFRWAPDLSIATVTYPDLGCYGTMTRSDDPNMFEETITVGDCESGSWMFRSGDITGGSAEYSAADAATTGRISFRHSEWDDIEGEIGIARSGPVLDFYRTFTGDQEAESTQAKGSCDSSTFDAMVEDWPGYLGTLVPFCDGEWAVAGENGTDAVAFFHFVDGEWTFVDHDGIYEPTGHRCWNIDPLREQGAPEGFLEKMVPCE